jgi:hypothetical protein
VAADNASAAVEVLEVRAEDAAVKVAGRSQLWSDIRRDGRVAYGVNTSTS